MKRKLLKQMGAEWRSNMWLATELLIISVVLFFIVDSLFTRLTIINEPLGFDTDHCYLINLNKIPEHSPEYIPNRSDQERNQDIITILDRLKSRPEIESVAMSLNGYFYNLSNNGERLTIDILNPNDLILRTVTPEFTQVFRIHGSRGETPEQMSKLLEKPHSFLISENTFEETYGIKSMKDFIGRDFNSYYNDTLRLEGTYDYLRYDDYIPQDQNRSMLMGMSKKYYYWLNELEVRVHENMDHDFIENLMKDADSQYRIGNYFISSVKSFDDIKYIYLRNNIIVTRFFYAGAAFLALNIFLGLLGTFWFRTSQRMSEIAIRMVNGASRTDILRRVLGEGQMLLLIVTPIAALFDYGLTYLELNQPYHNLYFEPSRFAVCVLIAWGFMSLMIFLGVIIPAIKAMRMKPAIALKTE